MSDHDTITPETDNEIRARLQAFARQVAERADTEAALRRMPRRSRTRTIGVVAIAACLLAIVVLSVVIVADRKRVDTVDPSDTPTQTIDGPTTLARGVVGFVEPPASQGCCAAPDGGLNFPAGSGLGGQTLDVIAEERDGEVIGEARFDLFVADPGKSAHGTAVEFECADTDTGDVILGGKVTTSSGGIVDVGDWIALLIREGEPDRATVWWNVHVSSCSELLESVPYPRDDDRFVDVVDGGDIETGRPAAP
jgi:hypothetical protein